MKKRLIIYGGANDIKLDGEIPQYIYKIEEDGEIGDKIGTRTRKVKGKGYDYNIF